MSDTWITALATIITAIIGAITSIIIAIIQYRKREEVQPKDEKGFGWLWVAGGIIIGAAIGLLIAYFINNRTVVIDDMNSLDGWEFYKPEGNENKSVLVEGCEKQAIEMIYNIVPGGYVGISKILDAPPPENTQAMIFDYRGEGSSNMLEVKVIYAPDANGNSAVFSYDMPKATTIPGWQTITIPYKEFRCWAATGCREGELVVPSQIWKIDFAVSSKEGGQAGVGTIAIDRIRVR